MPSGGSSSFKNFFDGLGKFANRSVTTIKSSARSLWGSTGRTIGIIAETGGARLMPILLFADLLTLTTNGGKNDASVRNHNEFYEQQKENNRRRIEEEDILFYTVQNEANANRLRTTGYPFPSEPNKSDIGEGVYSWETYEEALSHKSHLENNRGVAGLEIMVLGIKKGVFANLLQKDLTLLSDNNREIWHRRYAKTWGGVPNHGLQYIRRANRFGFEHYFHHSIFHLLKFY